MKHCRDRERRDIVNSYTIFLKLNTAGVMYFSEVLSVFNFISDKEHDLCTIYQHHEYRCKYIPVFHVSNIISIIQNCLHQSCFAANSLAFVKRSNI